jgi:hypothetical protein
LCAGKESGQKKDVRYQLVGDKQSGTAFTPDKSDI